MCQNFLVYGKLFYSKLSAKYVPPRKNLNTVPSEIECEILQFVRVAEYFPDCCIRVTILSEYLNLDKKVTVLLIRCIMSNSLLSLEIHPFAMDLMNFLAISYCVFESTGKVYTAVCSFSFIVCVDIVIV